LETNVNNTFFTGRFLLHLPSVDSTNTFAKDYIAKNSPIDGTVILADDQFAGRGQIGNVWVSEPNKNLTFSIIYRTVFLAASEQFFLNMAISLGICTLIEKELKKDANKSVKIKWPNDIYVDNKKIAGILIENTISGMHLNYSVIGIGLNVNQQDFPEGLSATSLYLEIGKEADKRKLLEELLASVEKYYLWLKDRKLSALKMAYLPQLFRLGVVTRFKKGNLVFEGKIIDVELDGRLIIDLGNGREIFSFKEVELVV